jgi:hypothetical protein
MLRQADLVIWDEVPMQHRYGFEAVERLFIDLKQDPNEPRKLFGGVPFLLGGDFAQTLPVVKRAPRSGITAACLQRSFLWRDLTVLRLTQNMRLPPTGVNREFADWLHDMSYNTELYGSIELPPYLRERTVQSMEQLCNQVFPATDFSTNMPDDYFADRAILTMRNKETAEFNDYVVQHLPGALEARFSVNKAVADGPDDDLADYTPEYLQSIDSSGLPPSVLNLKPGMPVMLLRNIRPAEGLCNGTRLRILELRPHVIMAKVLTGDHRGSVHLIPRITLTSNDTDLPCKLARTQFPVRPCFAITVNKSQGQSLQNVGVDLRTPAFSHGQLYVALSRVTDVQRLSIIMSPDVQYTQNIVWREVLEAIMEPTVNSTDS